MQRSVEYWVKYLNLLPHPEGGFYKETYRSESILEPFDVGKKRNLSTGIYFLITKGNFSAFHRIKSDEMWHFYAGSPLSVHIIDQQGKFYTLNIGNTGEKDQTPQAIVPAGAWFASESCGDYSLVGCTVSPGFDFEDFELAKSSELCKLFPNESSIIQRLTRL